MNNKAQAGPVGFIFNILFFLLFIGIAGGTLWGLFGMASAAIGATGIEAFILDNFAIVVLVGTILGSMAFFYFAGGK